MSERLVEISDPRRDRYATLNLISWWDQARVRGARVMVVGAGALGNEVLKNLALLGIGRILIADFDHVEASNLSRSVLFRMADAGRRKVDVAAERLAELNPDVRVATFHGNVVSELGLGVYRQMDVVLGCLDNRAARLAVNRACWKVAVPWIDGALDVLMGTARVFIPPQGACYECTMTEQDYALANHRYSCPAMLPEDVSRGRLPTLATTASVIAAIEVQEALKLLHGMETPVGAGIVFYGQTHRMSLLRYSRREDCHSHQVYQQIVELDAGVDDLTVEAVLDLAADRTGPDAALLVDPELVTTFSCRGCGDVETVYRPFDSVVPREVSCRRCGANRIPAVATRLTKKSPGAGVPLRQIGILPLDVVTVESAGGRFHFELTKDRQTVLPCWKRT